MSRRLATIALAVALAGAAAGLFVTWGERPRPPAVEETSGPAPTPPTERSAGDDPMAAIEREITFRRSRAEARTDSWLDLELLARAYLDRERLSGDYHDFGHAEAALDEAFARAPAGAGPFLVRAQLNFTLHRLARVEPDLVAIDGFAVPAPSDTEAVRGMRADVAFQMGHYDDALRIYEAQLAESREPANLVALAQYRWRTGDVDGARLLLDEADVLAARSPESVRAWLALVRGLVELDAARFPAAREAFERGLELTPGWWQLEEHLAQLRLLEGDTTGALAAYEALVDRVGSAELMDAVAAIHRDEGRTTEMLAWRERARTAHEERLALYPEAAAGHAIGHWLELEDEPDRLVEIAETNRDARPGGEAQTKLAQAYLRAGRLEEAREIAELVEATPWRAPESEATFALVYEATGDAELAETHRTAAESLAPGAMDRIAWLRP